MKKIIFYASIFGLMFAINSCANDSEDDLIDETPIPQLVTYNSKIKSIIDNNCISCHANPPVNGKNDYEAVKNNVSTVINRISKQEGESGLMPIGGPRLPQNLIDEVVQWQTDGLLEQ